MPRKGDLAPWPNLGPRDGAYGLTALCRSHLQHMKAKSMSPHTIKGHRQGLLRFLVWCAERDLATPADLQLPQLESFQYFLSRRRKRNGYPLGQRQQRYSLEIVRTMMRYGHKRGWMESNPADLLEFPRAPKSLPMYSLSPSEVLEVLALPDVGEPQGLRDRAMMELMYSSGLRRSEVVALTIAAVDLEHGLVRVHNGKGNKDRVVPVSERALSWLGRYVVEARPLVSAPGEQAFFVSCHRPGHMNPDCVTHAFGVYLRRAGKSGACHIFRHTMATQMLNGGADIRFVQEMLGHSSLNTTQVYTHVSVEKLRQVHAATHPAADASDGDPA